MMKPPPHLGCPPAEPATGSEACDEMAAIEDTLAGAMARLRASKETITAAIKTLDQQALDARRQLARVKAALDAYEAKVAEQERS